jgi:ATP-dependent Clp protease ATP-binding subunit ClpB
MIFMTSNLGATEMSNLVAPKLGFQSLSSGNQQPVEVNPQLAEKMSKSGIDAARRKFTPEFMNRIDKIVVFKPLGQPELRRILDLELNQVQERILQSPSERPFVVTVSDAGKQFLLQEGTDVKYGARHLKRAIERLLVHPVSNLIATEQVQSGDWVEADLDSDRKCLVFTREAESLEMNAMVKMIGESVRWSPALAAQVPAEQVRAAAMGKPRK